MLSTSTTEFSIYVDADACPVRDEVVRVAERHGMRVRMVSNGGIRPSRHPLVELVIVTEGPDVADRWIADRIGSADICVTADVPLAARCLQKGARALRPNGERFTLSNIGTALALRDLAADLRAADPWRQGGGKPFGKSSRSRFLDALETEIRALRG
jgi:uncharacterized protein